MTRLDKPSLLTSHGSTSNAESTSTIVEDFTQIMDLRKSTINQVITEMESDDVDFETSKTEWGNFPRHLMSA